MSGDRCMDGKQAGWAMAGWMIYGKIDIGLDELTDGLIIG